MKNCLIIILLPISMQLFAQDLGKLNCLELGLRRLSILGDSVQLFIPERFRFVGEDFYSETISFDTTLYSENKSDYFNIAVYDFRPWKEISPPKLKPTFEGIVKKPSSTDSIMVSEIKKSGNFEVGVFKLLFKSKKAKKLYCVLIFNLPDSRSVQIRMITQYTKLKNAEMDCVINSLLLK